jgi:hypothetical protein
MSEHTNKPSTVDDEIDLSVVFRSIRNFFKNILIGIINIFRFYWRHKFILLGLIVLGAALGYFWENSFDKTYKNQLIVIPNFNSSNYLYSKIESLENKISSKDTVFLKELFGEQYKLVKSIEISPVVDIYSFVSRSESNQNLFELFFEEEANLEFLDDPINSRNYDYHTIEFSVKGEENHKKFSDSLIKYLNQNTFFNNIQKISINSLKKQITENNTIVVQIDSILNYSKNQKAIQLEDNQLSFSDNSGLKELLKMKNELIAYERNLTEAMTKQNKVVNLVDANYKVIDRENFLKKSKIKLLPLVFVMFYSLISLLLYISKNAKELIN